MRRVVWTRAARDNVGRIESYVSRFAPIAAERLGERLTAAGESLAWFPEREMQLSRGRRALTLVSPYQIIFSFDDEHVFILRVRHGARRPLT